MVSVGLNRVVKDKRFEEYPPNPIQFRAACFPRGEELGLPSFTEAFEQAVGSHTDKHPSVIYAIRLLPDAFAFRQSKVEAAQAQFSEVWLQTLEHVMSGGELPEKPVEIEEQVDPVKAKQAGKEHLGNLKGMFS